MCLFDEYVAGSIEEALNHMKNEHHFDFYEIQKKNGNIKQTKHDRIINNYDKIIIIDNHKY